MASRPCPDCGYAVRRGRSVCDACRLRSRRGAGRCMACGGPSARYVCEPCVESAPWPEPEPDPDTWGALIRAERAAAPEPAA